MDLLYGNSSQSLLLSKGVEDAAYAALQSVNAIIGNVTTGRTVATEAHIPPHGVLFIFSALVIGALVRQLMSDWPIPYTVVLLVLGTCFGAVSRNYEEVQRYTSLTSNDPHLLLTVFLPVLLFESAFAMDVHTFYKMFSQVVILAVPGMALAAFLTAVMGHYVFLYNWSWTESMLFGSIVSATDPVAVVALLNSLGTSRQLGTIIEGESLLNDGCAIVFFNIFYDLSFKTVTVTEIGLYFPRLALGGFAWGLLTGKMTVFWLQHVFNDALVEICITLASTYLTYYIGEHVFHVSGVLSVVMLGMEINAQRTSISPEVEVFLHRFWEMLAYLANTLIFIFVGVAIMEVAFEHIGKDDWLYIMIDYFGITVIRFLVLLLFSPVLTRIGYGLAWHDAVVMIWGGLRGAVGLALALQVALDNPQVGNKMLLHTSGIVLLTLICNGTTIKPLLQMLGMSEISDSKRLAMSNAVNLLNNNLERTLLMLKTDRFLADADWSQARKSCVIRHPYMDEEAEVHDENNIYMRQSRCPKCSEMVPNQPSPKEFAEMSEDGRVAMIKAEKMSFWRQFERGMLSSEAVQVLVNVADTCMDVKDRLISACDIQHHWRVPLYWQKLRGKLEALRQVKASDRVPPPHNLFLRYNYLVATHVAFDAIMNILIALNMIPITLELISDDAWYTKYLRTINYVYLVIYILEVLIKFSAFRKFYFKDYWNIVDFFIVLLSIVDVILDFAAEGAMGSFPPGVLKVAKVFRILRMGRLLKLMKGLIPKLIDMVNNRVNRQLSFGYDIGKGFVVAEEEVTKVIEQLVVDKKIAQDLKMRSEKNRLDVVKSLGYLQREHPGIAISVKTRQAIRSVLNNARDTITDLRTNGVLDKTEAAKLERVIEENMKRQLNAPSFIPPKKPETLLRSLIWLKGMEDEAVQYITAQAEMMSFDYGDTMVKQGEPCDGIYLIVSGMVKLLGVSLATAAAVETVEGLEHSDLSISTDYLFAGNVIGEMGLLTDTVRNASVICETTVQAYFISLDRMNRAMRRFPELTDRLWRVSGIRISVPLLMEEAKYKGWTKDQVRLMCENSSMATFEDLEGVFEITDKMTEAVLVQGEVVSISSREVFLAPVVLPKMKRTYRYEKSDQLQILIIWNSENLKRGSEVPSSATSSSKDDIVAVASFESKSEQVKPQSSIRKRNQVEPSDRVSKATQA